MTVRLDCKDVAEAMFLILSKLEKMSETEAQKIQSSWFDMQKFGAQWVDVALVNGAIEATPSDDLISFMVANNLVDKTEWRS